MEFKIICTLSVLFLAGVSYAQSVNDLDTDELEKKIQAIPGLESFNSSKLPSEEDFEKIVRDKCEENGGGEEAYNALKNQQTAVQTCLEEQLNVTQIQLELEESKKTGSMDEVFGKYCKKYPEVHQCIEGVADKTRACLSIKEQEVLNRSLVIADELKEFLCFKDGDRIAMFVAEGGLECMESRKEELQLCVNKTIGSRIPSDISANNLPMLLLNERDCSDFEEIRKCVNAELEKCNDSTPANVVDAFFKFLKKQIPCPDVSVTKADAAVQGKSSGKTNVPMSILSIATFIVVYYRFM